MKGRERERYLHLDEIVRVTIEVIAYTFNFLYYRQIIMSCTFIAKTDLFNINAIHISLITFRLCYLYFLSLISAH